MPLRFPYKLFLACAVVCVSRSAEAQAGVAKAPLAPAAASGRTENQDRLAAIRRLASTGRGEQALQQLDALAATEPNLPGLERARGLALYDLQRLPEANKAFEKALLLDSRDEESAQMRGLTLFRLGRPAEAIPLLESSHGAGVQQKADPTYVLALCYTDTRRYDDARHAFARQYGFSEDSPSAYLLAARMLLRREYLPVAEKFANQAVTLDARLPLAHEVLGEIALAQNHLEDAALQFEREHANNPLEAAPYERLGDVYGRMGKYPQAREELQRAVLLEPNATGPYILLGKTTLKEGDAVAALTYLQRAESMDPANYMTHNLLAQTYRVLGRAAEASHELELTQKLQAADAPKLASPQ